VLGEADLVKFARLRPDPGAARAFVERAAALLDQWHAAAPPQLASVAPEEADAFR